MYGQLPNIATWKKKRADHIGVGGKRQALAAPVDAKGCGIVHLVEQRIGEGGRKNAFNQVVSSLAAAAMAEGDFLVAQVEFMAARPTGAVDFFQNRFHRPALS